MSWTKEDILPARDASGAPLALRGCDLDFLADAVRARGGTVAAAADAAGGPLSAARLDALLNAVYLLHETRSAVGGSTVCAPEWVDGDYAPVRADGTALSPAPSFVADWAVPHFGFLPFALSADALRRAFYDIRRMRTAVCLSPACDFSGLAVERAGADATGTPTPGASLYSYVAAARFAAIHSATAAAGLKGRSRPRYFPRIARAFGPMQTTRGWLRHAFLLRAGS